MSTASSLFFWVAVVVIVVVVVAVVVVSSPAALALLVLSLSLSPNRQSVACATRSPTYPPVLEELVDSDLREPARVKVDGLRVEA